jgi:NAD(P)-dependent dehydrogenase (short-subunit alcohol dehydrogenase family)
VSRVWFVTGSSRGLGRAITEAALEAGDRVVATARRPARLHDLTDRYYDHVLPLQVDVTRDDEVQDAVQAGLEAFGRYDVVVSNAGYADVASVEDVDMDDFRAQIDTDFLGVVRVTKAVLPILRRQGSGHIIQISSLGGRIGSPGLSAYQSAKWAVGGFSTVLAQEVAPLGIKVTVLEPSGMRTDWAGSSMSIPPISPPYQETVGALAEELRSVSGREELDPTEVAGIVRHLADQDEPPLRILVGAGAFQHAQSAAQMLAESDNAWRVLTESIPARQADPIPSPEPGE